MCDFCTGCVEGEEPPVTGLDGRAATEIALAAYRSIESGARVELPYEE